MGEKKSLGRRVAPEAPQGALQDRLRNQHPRRRAPEDHGGPRAGRVEASPREYCSALGQEAELLRVAILWQGEKSQRQELSTGRRRQPQHDLLDLWQNIKGRVLSRLS